MLYDHALEI